MAIDLKKKQKFDLAKKAPGLNKIIAGLGWDTSIVKGTAVDCDVAVFMLAGNNKIPADEYFVFYNNLNSGDNSVKHLGDNRDGKGDGDDESIDIDLSKVNQSVVQILFAVTIHEAEERGHSFGDIENAFIRIYNKNNNDELCRYTLNEQFTNSDSIIIGRLYRIGSVW